MAVAIAPSARPGRQAAAVGPAGWVEEAEAGEDRHLGSQGVERGADQITPLGEPATSFDWSRPAIRRVR